MQESILVVGWDGATPELILSLAEVGRLPNLSKLMDHGTSGILTSTVPPYSPPAWASFATGKDPGKHGVFDFYRRQPKTYHQSWIQARIRNCKPVWSLVSEAGGKVGIINVPMTYPPDKVNGFMISGFPIPAGRRDFTYPPDLLPKLCDEVGEYKVSMDPVFTHFSFFESLEDDFLRELYRVTETSTRASIFLLENFDWDLFIVVFTGSDRIQHYFWKHMDTKHYDHDPSRSKKYGSAILDYYCKLDEILGQLTARTNENTNVIVLSDHGFGPQYGEFYVNKWLVDLGLLRLKKKPRYARLLFSFGLARENIQHLLVKLGLINLIERLPRNVRELMPESRFSLSDIDWSNTKAYSFGDFGEIYVNLRGREPEGIVEPGTEYESIRNFIARELYNIENPETGERIIQKVFMKEDLYSGEFVSEAADLVFLSGYAKCRFQVPPETGEKTRVGSEKVSALRVSGEQSGTHRINGFFAMSGKFKEGLHINASIVDIAPTILYLMDLPVPLDMNGKILDAAIDPSYMKSHPIRYEEAHPPEEHLEHELSEDEMADLKNRLRSLGYID